MWSEPGAFEVAPGVHRIPLPLPNDGLRAVNVYAVEDGDGLVMIDSGWALEEAKDQLEAALGTLDKGFDDIRRFLVTHVHRDHFTMAVSLRRLFGSKIGLGLGEQPSLRHMLHGQEDQHVSDLRKWGADELAEVWVKIMHHANAAEALRDYEEPDEWLVRGTVELEHRTLEVIPTPGHTRGHVVFADHAAKVLFSGDHVLPHITPSIGFEPLRPELPLGDYLTSLRLTRELPDLRLLPAHGPVTDSSHARVDELIHHHERRLEEIHLAASGTAFETARKIGWTRRQRRFEDLDVFNQVLAVGETAAHLDVLVERGELTRTENGGVLEYSL
ncbi:Glyoxylase, beta-lactamase superfamily II [Lentzea fradiae]|uniref:Glyoxylase, beta-lactamase superfamily II n=1 Tax=Lentzea fradiae TaxID=200378 RepID=A0A1G7ZE66_9PSEU|nr:MBL fold metallo-hydrolase [Lentzea fradiae]SDH06974.1 Glyoxylase, beta-lactamase superfamily II [Lentzea fradiae]